MKGKKVAVIGAGLVGSLLAVLLAKRGIKVDVYERRPDLRKAKAIGGRSINLALSNRGFKTLEMANFAEEIKAISIPMYGRKMHDTEGNLTFQPYGKENEAIYSVSRGQLNQKLMNLADDYPDITYHFDQACEHIDFSKNEITFKDTNTHELNSYTYDHIFGTDGAYSAVRGSLQKTPMFNYSQQFLPHGYKELRFPEVNGDEYCFDKNCLHIWPRGEFMLIALPNLGGSFTVTLFFPMKGETSFESIDTEEKVKDFFKKTFPDAYENLPTLTEDFFNNPTSQLVTIRCNPWNYEDKAVILGDASHAVVPFYGQGLNAGMEDCSILMELLDDDSISTKDLFDRFSELRIKDGDAIADLSLYNYIEMRDLSGDEDFLLRKKIEAKFSELYPDKWMPLYSQVTFSHIPYSEALAAGKRQDVIMDEIMEIENIHEVWNEDRIMEKMLTLVV